MTVRAFMWNMGNNTMDVDALALCGNRISAVTDNNYLWYISFEKWYTMQIYFTVKKILKNLIIISHLLSFICI